jgi:hypothetical protein
MSPLTKRYHLQKPGDFVSPGQGLFGLTSTSGLSGKRCQPTTSITMAAKMSSCPRAWEVLAKYLKPDLLIIDMGMKQLPKRSGEYLLVRQVGIEPEAGVRPDR